MAKLQTLLKPGENERSLSTGYEHRGYPSLILISIRYTYKARRLQTEPRSVSASASSPWYPRLCGEFPS